MSRVMITSVVAGAPLRGEPDAALGEGFVLVGGGAVGVEVEPGLLNESFGVDLADPGRGGGDQPVGEQGGLDAEVDRVPGDLACPPHRNTADPDQVPQPREPVSELEGVGEQLPGGVVADRQGGGQVGGGELRDPGRAGAGERDQGLAVQVRLPPVRRGLVLGQGCSRAHTNASSSWSTAAAWVGPDGRHGRGRSPQWW